MDNVKRYLILVFFFLVGCDAFTQTNEWQLDAGFAAGVAYPIGSHKHNVSTSKNPTHFAAPGFTYRIDCHSGLGSGWKCGFLYSYYKAPIHSNELTEYLSATIETAGYEITSHSSKFSFYESGSWALQLANDIEFGNWTITPEIAIGLSALTLNFSSSYDLKQTGTSYSKQVSIAVNNRAGIGVAISPGLKCGYTFGLFSGVCSVFLLGEYFNYRSTVNLVYTTIDNLNNQTVSYQWFSGDIRYRSLCLGATYFLK